MTRPALAAVLAVLFLAAAARADIPVPPAPGNHFLPLVHRIETTAEHPDYVFFTVTGFGPQKVAFGPTAPALVHGAEARRGLFVAVPKGAAAKYPTEAALLDALRVGTVPGQLASPTFELRTEVPAADRRPGLVYTYTLEKLDPTAGIVVKKSAAPPAEAAPPPAPPVSFPAPEEAAAGPLLECGTPPPDDGYAPRGGALVAGAAAAVGLALAGVWLARRR